jgi:membrane AbrB-like protein
LRSLRLAWFIAPMTTNSTQAFRNPPLYRQLATVAAGGGGSALFLWLGVPGGGISGAMVIVTLMTVFGLAARIEGPIRVVAMVTSGVTLGAAVTPETLRGIATYPGSLLIMAAGVAATTAAGTIFLRLLGWSRSTALLATSPGAFAYIISVAPSVKGDVPRIVVVQMFRVLVLMAILPMLVVETAGPVAHTGPAPLQDPLWLVAAMLALGALGGYVFHKLKVAGGVFFGAMMVSAAFHGTGYAPGRLPWELAFLGQALIGAWTGSRFVGFDWRRLPTIAGAAFASILISIGVSALFAWFAAVAVGVPFGGAVIAFAPGALEAMTMLAFAIGFDPLYVGVHHLARFMLLNLTMPAIVRFWLEERKPTP